MPTEEDDTSTDETSTIDDTTTDDTPPGADDTTDEPTTLAEIAAMAKELGITPGQLKGRLDASKKWEARSKKADADLEAARLAALSEQERAIEEARLAGKAEATKETALELAAARLEAAGVPADKVGDLNLNSVLNDEGKVDAAKVAELAARHKAPAAAGGADAGPQGDTPKTPDLDEQIAAAEKAGDFKTAVALKTRKLATVGT